MNRTGRFKVIGGVISPVGDQYEKKVQKFVMFIFLTPVG